MKKMTAQLWNDQYPIGTKVSYHSIMPPYPGDEPLITETRSEAWELGHGEPVVSIKGKTGGVCLSHLTVLAACREAMGETP